MPCYDTRAERDREIAAMGDGLLCELLKYMESGEEPSPEFKAKLEEWRKAHQDRE
jgi:hypothetical protein